MKRPLHPILLTLVLSILGTGLLTPLFAQVPLPGDPEQKPTPVSPPSRPGAGIEHEPEAPPADAPTLIAVLTPTKGNETRGIATFEPLNDDQVRVTVRVSGLKANAKHGIHIHEFGDVSAPDGSSAGGHFNPSGTDHGLPESEVRHPGDFGNLQADAEGNANLVLTVKGLSLTEGNNAIIGRALVVHAGEDKGTQPTGDAGDRIAHGVIAVADPRTIQDRVAALDSPTGPGARTIPPRTPVTPAGEPSPAEELGEVAEEIGRGAGKAARTTAKAVERGVQEAEEALRKAGKKVEKAID